MLKLANAKAFDKAMPTYFEEIAVGMQVRNLLSGPAGHQLSTT